jgi:FSR family fosmidomycin resistance protein-like MFS transporter
VLSLSGLAAVLLEPALALLSDAGWRRRIVVGGGVAFAASLLGIATATSLPWLLIASMLSYPASGAFVSLAQATWMDLEPDRTERNMARWVLAGSVGAVAGPLLLGAAGIGGVGWRGAFVACALVAAPIVLATTRLRFPPPHPEIPDLGAAVRGALRALRRRAVLRWLALLQLADLLGDVLLGYLALYLVDVASASPSVAALGVAVLAGSALAGDALLVRLLRDRPSGPVLRAAALLLLVAYPAFLLLDPLPAKLALLVPIGVLHAGWYAIPQARLYAELPARGGTAVAIAAPADLVGSLLPLGIGAVAARSGLGAAMWLLLLAPVAMLALFPRTAPPEPGGTVR